MDKTDIKLLAALEANSRISLKNLAKDLNVKTSTIYHRLNKLQKSNVLDHFSIVINPNALGLTTHIIMTIRLKKMVIGKLDSMFLESFAKFLADQFAEIMFTSVAADEQIYIIGAFRDDDHFKDFEKQIKENPYVDSCKPVKLGKLVKGQKIFSFLPQLFKAEESNTLFDDSSSDQDHEGENDEEEDVDDDKEVVF